MDPSQPYLPITHKENKKSKENDSSTGVFCEFCRNFKNTFFKNISGGCFWRWTRRNQTAAHDIPIEQMLSLNDSLWIILATRQNGHVVTFFCSRPKVKWGKTKQKISFLCSFKKGNFSLEDGTQCTPSVTPLIFRRTTVEPPKSRHPLKQTPL